MVGVDEAGRGSFVGPLVVGAFAADDYHLDSLREAGARDSKELTPAAREAVYGRLLRLGQMASVALSPRTVDRAVRHGGLNDLEARAFGSVIRRLGGEEARVDACDTNEARFGRHVSARAGNGIRILARHHADRDDPLVGAASIVAKVRRDRALARLRATLGDGIGSGYPSDIHTVEFVRAHLRQGEGAPSWLRTSWATMGRVKLASPAVTLDRFAP
ncbi:MAG: ribonuclease HII [Thermoplasmata archaeon]|nr:ribonuclease HII [Thermoplasmata archaeon]